MGAGRLQKPGVEVRFIGQQEQPFGIGIQPADGFVQTVFNQNLPFRRNNFGAVEFMHVKSVNGRATFGDDARG